ncbi:MAG: fumarylacetoacetate hydrolase family protein [Tetrasphaera sp.]
MTDTTTDLPEGALARVELPSGQPAVVMVGGGGDLAYAEVDGYRFADLPELLTAAGGDRSRISGGPLVARGPELRLLPPVGRPRKILCVGQNYLDHVHEGGRTAGPEHPDLFAKWDNALTGPGDVLPLPPESDQIDFESELAVVIGTRARRVPAERVGEVVFGYTAVNDGSVRDFQFHTGQRTAGKAWDRLTPLGPVVVAAAELGGIRPDLEITGLLNGEVMQSDRTSNLLFDIPALIAYVTTFLTLEPGDLILTGTPAGVGAARKPPVWLRDGDVFEVRVEGIGSLRNRCATEVLP